MVDREKMDDLWSKVKRGLHDGAVMSMEKIEEYTKLGKLKIEEIAAKRKVERNFMDIGERTFGLIDDQKGATVAEDLAVRKSIDNIKSLKIELATIAEKMRTVQEEARKAHRTEPESNEPTGI